MNNAGRIFGDYGKNSQDVCDQYGHCAKFGCRPAIFQLQPDSPCLISIGIFRPKYYYICKTITKARSSVRFLDLIDQAQKRADKQRIRQPDKYSSYNNCPSVFIGQDIERDFVIMAAFKIEGIRIA
jgi:hypothetical protein